MGPGGHPGSIGGPPLVCTGVLVGHSRCTWGVFVGHLRCPRGCLWATLSVASWPFSNDHSPCSRGKRVLYVSGLSACGNACLPTASASLACRETDPHRTEQTGGCPEGQGTDTHLLPLPKTGSGPAGYLQGPSVHPLYLSPHHPAHAALIPSCLDPALATSSNKQEAPLHSEAPQHLPGFSASSPRAGSASEASQTALLVPLRPAASPGSRGSEQDPGEACSRAWGPLSYSQASGSNSAFHPEGAASRWRRFPTLCPAHVPRDHETTQRRTLSSPATRSVDARPT